MAGWLIHLCFCCFGGGCVWDRTTFVAFLYKRRNSLLFYKIIGGISCKTLDKYANEFKSRNDQELSLWQQSGWELGTELGGIYQSFPCCIKTKGKQKGNKLQSPNKGSRGEHSTCKKRSSRHKAAIVPTPRPRQWQHVVGLLRRRACAPAAGWGDSDQI